MQDKFMKKNLIAGKEPQRFSPWLKRLLIMKMLVILLLVVGLTSSYAESDAQTTKLNLKVKSGTVKDVIGEIERQTDLSFMYDNNVFNVDRPVSIEVENATVQSLVEKLISGENLKYEMVNRYIVITALNPTTSGQQQKSVSGKVTDSSGDSLPGVSVAVKGTTNGTITDGNGNYSLSNIPENAILQFSFVGMKTQEVVVGRQSIINIAMLDDAIGIEEVVAIGYGTQKKVNLTGSITTVKADELTDVPVPTISQAIMGRSPGVFIKNKQGQPGENGIDINIRGFGNPLIIVDERPVTMNFFQQLEPGDIESFNILKDASAAAVYGARAGNGVILVTTKRGTISAPKISYRGNYSLQFFANVPEFVDAAQYAAMKNVGLVYTEGKDPIWTDEEIQKFRDGSDLENYPNTNWWNETFRDFAPQQQHSVSVSGGTETVKYFTSVNYFNQKDMHVSDDTDYNRLSMRSNLDIKMSEKFNIGFDFSLANQDFTGPSTKMERGSSSGIMTTVLRSLPYASNDPLPDPTKVPAMLRGAFTNPYYMGLIEHVGFNKWNRLYAFAKLKVEYELPFGFKAKAAFDMNGAYYRDRLRQLEMPQYDYDAETEEYILRAKYSSFNSLQETNSITKNFNQQYFLTWDKIIKDHQLNALFVYEILSNDYDFLSAYRRDFEFDLDYLFAGSELNKDNNGYATEGGRKAYVSRINYNYKDKYMVEFSSRWDGSPKFPANTRWGFFPSASVGWRISEEPFILNNVPVITNLKLRASYGKLGFDAAGAFQYLSTFEIRSQYIYDEGLQSGIRADALPNPNITWEKMTTTNVGLDFNLWDGRLLEGSFDYFYRLRTDVLGKRVGSVSDVVGATLPDENFYEFDNRGWELTLRHAYKIGELGYSIGGNISINREKTIFRDQAEFASMEAYRRGNQVGEWTDRFWAYPTEGLFQLQEEIDGWADIDGAGNRTIKPGDIKFVDYNGDGMISPEDMIVTGRGVNPRLMFGIDVSFSWKGFELSTLWQGAGLNNFDLRGGGTNELMMPFKAQNTPNTFMYNNMYTPENPWIPANTTGAVWPRYFANPPVAYSHPNFAHRLAPNQFWLADGTYARLKNVQLAYTIPGSITQEWGIDLLKVYVAGYDVLTFYEYDFIDPEIDTNPANSFGDYHPIMGSYTFGLQIDF